MSTLHLFKTNIRIHDRLTYKFSHHLNFSYSILHNSHTPFLQESFSFSTHQYNSHSDPIHTIHHSTIHHPLKIYPLKSQHNTKKISKIASNPI